MLMYVINYSSNKFRGGREEGDAGGLYTEETINQLCLAWPKKEGGVAL